MRHLHNYNVALGMICCTILACVSSLSAGGVVALAAIAAMLFALLLRRRRRRRRMRLLQDAEACRRSSGSESDYAKRQLVAANGRHSTAVRGKRAAPALQIVCKQCGADSVTPRVDPTAVQSCVLFFGRAACPWWGRRCRCSAGVTGGGSSPRTPVGRGCSLMVRECYDCDNDSAAVVFTGQLPRNASTT